MPVPDISPPQIQQMNEASCRGTQSGQYREICVSVSAGPKASGLGQRGNKRIESGGRHRLILLTALLRASRTTARAAGALKRLNHRRDVGQHLGEEVRQPILGMGIVLVIVLVVAPRTAQRQVSGPSL